MNQTWLNAVDQIAARGRTLARLSADPGYKGRIPSLVRTRGDLLMAHQIIGEVLADFEKYESKTQPKTSQTKD